MVGCATEASQWLIAKPKTLSKWYAELVSVIIWPESGRKVIVR